MQLCLQVGEMKHKLRMISMSLIGSVVAGLGETYITIFLLFFKVVQNVYVSCC